MDFGESSCPVRRWQDPEKLELAGAEASEGMCTTSRAPWPAGDLGQLHNLPSLAVSATRAVGSKGAMCVNAAGLGGARCLEGRPELQAGHASSWVPDQ